MTEYPGGRGDSHSGLQRRLGIVALVAVVLGVLVLAAAAFLLSYAGLHLIALQAGVTHDLATLYPVIFDAMLVTAGAAALALRGAGWWAKFYVWLCLLLLLAAVGTGSAVHAMDVTLPRQPTRAGVAIAPWALLLLGFGVWLVLLRHLRQSRRSRRRHRATAADRATARVVAPRADLDSLLSHREGPAPAIAAAASTAPAPALTAQVTPAPGSSQSPVPTVPPQSPPPAHERPAVPSVVTAADTAEPADGYYVVPGTAVDTASAADDPPDITYGHSGYVHPASYDYGEYLGYTYPEQEYAAGGSEGHQSESDPEDPADPADLGPDGTAVADGDAETNSGAEAGSSGAEADGAGTGRPPAGHTATAYDDQATAHGHPHEAEDGPEPLAVADDAAAVAPADAETGTATGTDDDADASAEPSFERVRSTPTPPVADTPSPSAEQHSNS